MSGRLGAVSAVLCATAGLTVLSRSTPDKRRIALKSKQYKNSQKENVLEDMGIDPIASSLLTKRSTI